MDTKSTYNKKGQLVCHSLDGPSFDKNYIIWGWQVPKETFPFWVKNQDIIENLENLSSSEQATFEKLFFKRDTKKGKRYFHLSQTFSKKELDTMRKWFVTKYLES